MATITGNAKNNSLSGSSNDDEIFGLEGKDKLLGRAGDDILVGGTGADIINGGDGFDFASYITATSGVAASLWFPNQGNDSGGDTYVSIEGLIGSAFDDQLSSDAGNNILRGAAGDDVLSGGDGADVLDGGSGVDTARYDIGPGGVTASLRDPGINTGAAAGDTYISIEDIWGTWGDDKLYGDDNDNLLLGGQGSDLLDGGRGFDTVSYNYFDPDSVGPLVVSLADVKQNAGLAAGDRLVSIEAIVGSIFDDVLIGNNAKNSLDGGGGNDRLKGGAGNDILDGGFGNDTLEGGTGKDEFVLSRFGRDLVSDFNVADDTLLLKDFSLSAGPLSKESFFTGVAAHDASDRFIYDSATGKLWYDFDGSGSGSSTHIATLSSNLALTNKDFSIV